MQEGGIKKWESYNGKGNITLGNRKGMDVRNEGGRRMEGGGGRESSDEWWKLKGQNGSWLMGS